MGQNLHAASSQWASRPADERFWNVTDMGKACVAARDGSGTITRALGDLRVEHKEGSLALYGKGDTAARFTHYSFGQLARTIGAPADYLRTIPATYAAECVNFGIAEAARSGLADRDLLFHKNGALTLRAMTSDKYERVWDADLCVYLRELEAEGWRAPAGRWVAGEKRAATEADILPGQINISVGTEIGPAGLYASDHDLFAFMVAPDRVISDGAGGSLMRGLIARNSEVGDCSLTFSFFCMQAVCGNHIIWNVQDHHDIKIRHVGRDPLGKAVREFRGELRRYSNDAPAEEARIVAARSLVLGTTKDDVLAAVMKYARSHSIPLSRTRVSDAIDVAADHTDWYGNPFSCWGVVAGLTHASQGLHADSRTDTDRAAGRCATSDAP